MFKLIGGSLVAINEVTKKEVASIDLRRATAISDLNAAGSTPKSRMTMRGRGSDEGVTSRPRSFLVEFEDGEELIFAADKDEEKTMWCVPFSDLGLGSNVDPGIADHQDVHAGRIDREDPVQPTLGRPARDEATRSGGCGVGEACELDRHVQGSQVDRFGRAGQVGGEEVVRDVLL